MRVFWNKGDNKGMDRMLSFISRNMLKYLKVVTQEETERYMSSGKEIKHGVPQGSVLGPLLLHYI